MDPARLSIAVAQSRASARDIDFSSLDRSNVFVDAARAGDRLCRRASVSGVLRAARVRFARDEAAGELSSLRFVDLVLHFVHA